MIVGATGFQMGQAMPRSAVGSASSSLQQVSMAAKAPPHGGKLIDLFKEGTGLTAADASKTIEITERQSCDVELLCNGGLSPLTGFLNEDAYKAVVENMKLPDGNILGLPIVMDTDDEDVKVGDKVLLKFDGTDMAVMTVESKWSPDKPLECIKCYGTATICLLYTSPSPRDS